MLDQMELVYRVRKNAESAKMEDFDDSVTGSRSNRIKSRAFPALNKLAAIPARTSIIEQMVLFIFENIHILEHLKLFQKSKAGLIEIAGTLKIESCQ